MLSFIGALLTVHTGIMILGARLLRLPRPLAIIASNAAVGGPGTAAAMAAAKGWTELLPIGVFLGSVGYAVGTGIGLAVFRLLM